MLEMRLFKIRNQRKAPIFQTRLGKTQIASETLFEITIFQSGNFIDSDLMSAAVKWRFHPDFDNVWKRVLADGVSGKAQNIKVVVTSADFSKKLVLTYSRSNAAEFVSRQRHADSGSANQNTPFADARTDFLRYLSGDIWIIYATGAFRSAVINSMTQPFKDVRDLMTDVNSAMVAADGYFHKFYLECLRVNRIVVLSAQTIINFIVLLYQKKLLFQPGREKRKVGGKDAVGFSEL